VTERRIVVRGRAHRISIEGDLDTGPPLLLCNGLGASLELWEPLRLHLAGLPTIAFDAPGVGGSDAPCYPPRVRDIAATLVQVLTELNVGQVDVLGVSWGGALAQELARRHPERVRRLVLAATTPGVVAVPGDPRAVAVLATPLRYWSRSYYERVAPLLYGDEIMDDPGLLRRQGWIRFSRQVSLRGYAWQLLAPRRWTSLPWLHKLQQPTLIIAGDADPIIPLANARILAARIPDTTLHVVAGGGHLLLLTRAVEMGPRIAAFLPRGPDDPPPMARVGFRSYPPQPRPS
jgi:poly(3-hydroxyoctanoate) depolymerase